MGMQDIIRIFADKMYQYRKEAGLTQEELADLLGLDNSYVSLLERGARVPSLISLDQIAKVFGVKPHDLLIADKVKGKHSFRQKELIYIIQEAGPEKINKIRLIMNTLKEPTSKKSK